MFEGLLRNTGGEENVNCTLLKYNIEADINESGEYFFFKCLALGIRSVT